MIFAKIGRREELLSKFLKANEVRQRVVKETVASDTQVINDLANEVKLSKKVLEDALQDLVLGNMFKKSMPFVEILIQDTNTMDQSLAQQFYNFVETELKVTDIENDLKTLEDMMRLDAGGMSDLLDALESCRQLETVNTTGMFDDFSLQPNVTRRYGLDTIVGLQDNSSFDAVKAWLDSQQTNKANSFVGVDWEDAVDEILSDNSSCQDRLPIVVDGLKTALWTTASVKMILQNLLQTYMIMIDQAFYNTGANVSTFPEHIVCVSSLQALIQNFYKTLNALPDDLDPQDLDDLIQLTGIAVNISLARRQADLTSSFYNAKKCNWMEMYNNVDNIASYLQGMRLAQHRIVDVTSFSSQLTPMGEDLLSVIQTSGALRNASNLALSYLAGDTTKLDVSEMFYDMSFVQMLEDLYTNSADYKRKASEMMSAYSKAWFTVKWVFEESIGLFNQVKVPIMNETFVMKLGFTQSGRPDLVAAFMAATESRAKMAIYYDITVQVFADMFGDYLRNISDKVDVSMRSLKKAIIKTQKPLKEHLDACNFGPSALM